MKDLISRLMSDERRRWQDPERIIELSGIREGMCVADIGAGPGFFTIPIARKVGSRAVVYAIEKEREMVRYLRNNIRREGLENVVRIVHAPAERTGLEESSVDAVFIVNVFHDILDHNSLLTEIHRILKENGTVVNIDWKKKHSPFGPPLQIKISMKNEVEIFGRNGFRLIRGIYVGPYHYGFIMAKRF